MTTIAPYNWLRKVPAALKNLDEVPLLGNPPFFNWPLFEKELGETLGLKDLVVKTTPVQACESSHFKEGFENPDILYFRVAPLKGQAALLFPTGDLDKLFQFLAQKEIHHHLIDREFKEAFQRFFLLEAFSACQKAFSDRSLSPQILEEGSLTEEIGWISDISLSWAEGAVSCRLVIPDELSSGSFKDKYKQPLLNASPVFYSSITLDVHAETGRTHLSRKEWNSLQKGDYLILESCHILPGDDKGRVLLTVNGTPVFRAKIKDGSIKILETPQFYELGTPMPPTTPPHDDLRDEELDENEEEFDDEFTDEEELEAEEEEGALPPLPQTKGKVASAIEPQKPFKADDIPLEIIVEVGRFQMTVQKLSELQPGNLIDLDIHPENGVDLVVNGTCIARGELLKIGDTLGVRILDIAK